ncbi:MAG: sulfate adenylyltransferase, partial [Clostridia bacterium]|nr:sulfate adenylyltransferase [Clostridia bacterium]
KVTEILKSENYTYGGVPVINGRGFEIKAKSNEEIQTLLREYNERKNDSEFFSKWVNFGTYREIVLK